MSKPMQIYHLLSMITGEPRDDDIALYLKRNPIKQQPQQQQQHQHQQQQQDGLSSGFCAQF